MKRVWFLSGVLVLAFGSIASAITVADINSAPAGTYCPEIYGTGCFQIGDKIFRDITVGGTAASGVTVTGQQIDDTVFIQFGGPFSAADGADNDYQINYNVTALGGLIEAITQSFGPSIQGTGAFFVAIGENVFSDAAQLNHVAQSSVGCVFAECDVADPPGELIQGDDLLIAPPLQRVWVQKDIEVAALEGGVVSASIIRQGFKQVPEPAHAALLLGACMIAGLYFKSRKRAEA